MEIREYTTYREDEILRLYAAVGWTAYTENRTALRQGFEHSLLVLAAYENGELIGVIRVVGDGYTVVFLQDLLVLPEKQRQGVGTALMRAVLTGTRTSGRSNWRRTTRLKRPPFTARWDSRNFRNSVCAASCGIDPQPSICKGN